MTITLAALRSVLDAYRAARGPATKRERFAALVETSAAFAAKHDAQQRWLDREWERIDAMADDDPDLSADEDRYLGRLAAYEEGCRLRTKVMAIITKEETR